MKTVQIDLAFFEGVVSVERGDGWLRPWRLPSEDLNLFVAPGNSLVDRARESSGARLRFETNSGTLGIRFRPLSGAPVQPTHALDLTIDSELVCSAPAAVGSENVTFRDLPEGDKVVEIWLPHAGPIELTGMELDDGATCRAIPDRRPKWVTYGSSLTHCRRAHSPARTWPAIAARRKELNLTSLGYGGNCCLEPMVGLMIRDLPADLITLKLGINCIGGALSPRTFPGAVMGLVRIIREKHPDTPLALISPIGYPPHETQPNVLGYTISQMRADIRDVHGRLKARGDRNLYYFDGLDVFSVEEIGRYSADQCHPNADGIEVMADHFLERVLSRLPV